MIFWKKHPTSKGAFRKNFSSFSAGLWYMFVLCGGLGIRFPHCLWIVPCESHGCVVASGAQPPAGVACLFFGLTVQLPPIWAVEQETPSQDVQDPGPSTELPKGKTLQPRVLFFPSALYEGAAGVGIFRVVPRRSGEGAGSERCCCARVEEQDQGNERVGQPRLGAYNCFREHHLII